MALGMTRLSPKTRYWAKEILIAGGVFAIVFLGVRFFDSERQRGCGGDLPKGAAAAEFVLPNLTGSAEISLRDLRGKPVLLNFWATWCGTCREELPELQALHTEARGRYHVITIAHDNPSALRAVARREGLTFPILHDRRGAVNRAYQANKIPKTVLIDPQGRIVHDFVGAIDGDILRQSLAELNSK